MSTIHKVSPLLGESFAMEELRDFIVGVSILQEPVLITGQCGTGKSLAATKVHAVGRHAGRPQTRVTCSRFEADELELLLFGGAGTESGSADVEESGGVLNSPHVGTCYVAQIEELTLQLSRRLGRYLDQRVQGNVRRGPRLIFGSCKDLSELQREGEVDPLFLDLASQYHMRIPPLQDRSEDIPVLCNYHIWLNSPSEDYEERWADFQSYVLPELMQYRWPGNINELIEVVHTFCGLSDATGLTASVTEPTSPDAYYLQNVFRECYQDFVQALKLEKVSGNPYFLMGAPSKWIEEGRYAG